MSLPIRATDLAQKYAIVAALGRGGMSVIHLAAARGLGNVQKLVVLKSIRPELLSNEKVLQMFMDEARWATRLTHPNIVQTYEVVMLSGRPVLVMEYMEGQSLSNVLRKAADAGGVSLAMHLRILSEALAGLDHAHNLTDYDGKPVGLVHRDVSPQNVFVTYDGHVKILDFGIAKAEANASHTELGELKGKIRYMAPEQMEGSSQLDRRADVFAVGVMLWEALARKRLWLGTPDVDVLQAVLNTGVPAPRTVNPHVEPWLEAICMKALARNPDERYESCAHLQADIEQAALELGLRANSNDIGRLVKELFRETRSKIRAAIDHKLKAVDAQPGALSADAFLETDALLSNAGGGSLLPHATGGTTITAGSRSTLPWALALMLSLLLLAGGAFTVYGHEYAPTLTRRLMSSLAAAPVTATASPPLEQNVAVHLGAAPNHAKLYFDGKMLPANPFIGQLPTDKVEHELRAEAPGYAPQSVAVWLAGSADINVDLTLESPPPSAAQAAEATPAAQPQPAPAVLAKGAPRAVAGRATPSVAAKATSTPTESVSPKPPAPPSVNAEVNCDHPFYIDAKGIRHIRAECN